tara:strand:- start:413 stop:532 length:120 start_codon:yes stop_codon:yes gene_type:complete
MVVKTIAVISIAFAGLFVVAAGNLLGFLGFVPIILMDKR